MDILSESHLDFMGFRRPMVVVSTVLVLVSLVGLMGFRKLNLGIDFAGGTQIIVRFAESPEIDELRGVLAAGGAGDALIQRFGESGANEVLIKMPLVGGEEEGSRDVVVSALDARFGSDRSGFDLNKGGHLALAGLLTNGDPDDEVRLGAEEASAHYTEIAARIMEVRRDVGLFSDWSQLDSLELSAPVRATLEKETYLGPYSVLGVESVGPQIGSELRTKGMLAVAFSLIGMLAYIWYRFELRFGVGAIVALTHDVVIGLGFYALLGYEFNLTTIAAFLTLVGYSVNDTVIIFDRVRENLRRSRREPLSEVINRSLNQTLSRTLLTSGTTILVVGTLYVFGGDVLRGFSFVLLLGIVVGTYSSIFVASPVVLLWERFRGRS